MSLHRYDGADRHFHDGDDASGDGLAIVARLLGLRAVPSGARYDLHFYSGGIGVVDRFAITLPVDPAMLETIVAAVAGKTPEEAASDPAWRDDFVWLVQDAAAFVPIDDAAARFINHERRCEFQPSCHASDAIWFEADSGVNHWVALWYRGGMLSYLGYDQG